MLLTIVHHSVTHFSAIEQMCSFAHFGDAEQLDFLLKEYVSLCGVAPGNKSELKDSGLTPQHSVQACSHPSHTHTHEHTLAALCSDAVCFHVSTHTYVNLCPTLQFGCA